VSESAEAHALAALLGGGVSEESRRWRGGHRSSGAAGAPVGFAPRARKVVSSRRGPQTLCIQTVFQCESVQFGVPPPILRILPQ
jgi:hypothetical protein